MVNQRAVAIVVHAQASSHDRAGLAPPLTPAEANLLQRAFLRDVTLAAAGVPDAAVCVFVPVGADVSTIENVLPPNAELRQVALRGPALLGAGAALLAEGAAAVVSVAASVPTLPRAAIEHAFALVEADTADIVLAPSEDGSISLVALGAGQPEMLVDIDWSSVSTLEAARQAGHRIELLPVRCTVDNPTTLELLVNDLQRDPTLAAPATRIALQGLRHGGARLPDAVHPWQTLESTVIHETPWRTLHSDRVRISDGLEIDYSYFTSADAVWIVPLTPAGEIVFIRQYRYPLRDWTLELPAGAVDRGTLAEAAARELREEVGGVAGELRYIGSFYGAVAHASLRRNVFLALDVRLGEAEREPTELLTPALIPAELAFDMARRGEINDGESALTLLYCEREIREHLGRLT